ncbi:SEN1 N terminal-domain-containing protein [Xylariaceae sp. FL0016]|nr:SEN1 N terminal-domain-containing protein [Xylariaceae sp. FL0016]
MAEVNNLLENAFKELQDVPPENHLFCPKISEEDAENYDNDEDPENTLSPHDREERIQGGLRRLHQMYSCSLILGIDPETAGAFRSQFLDRSDAFLRSCAACVRNWHKARKQFLKDMAQIYDDQVVDELENRLNQFDFTRISDGLRAAHEFLLERNGVATQSTFVKAGREELLIALYEAICCMPYLSLPENRTNFNFVFEGIQQSGRVLKLQEVLPTMTFFLFDENPIRNKFAVHAFEKNPAISREDFEWAISDNLEKAILKANDTTTDAAFLHRFWQGFLTILDALDEELVLHSLRAMTVQPSIYDLMLAQISRISSVSTLKLLLKVFCQLIQKSNKAFWGAFGNYAPSAILEQVIRSPAFRPLLMQSGEHDMTPDGPAATSWVRPLVESINPNNRFDVCDKLLHYLLGDFAVDAQMPTEGKLACYRGAMTALACSLSAFSSPKYTINAGTSTIYTNKLLNLTLKHNELIIQLARHENTAIARLGLSVISFSLMLDARIACAEFSALGAGDKHVQTEIQRDSTALWESFLEILQQGANELAKGMLAASVPLSSVERFRVKNKSNKQLLPAQLKFNEDFGKTAEAVGRVIDRLGEFDPAVLRQLCLESTTIFPIVAALVHGEDPINQASASFIKSVTGQERRSDAVLKMLEAHFVPVLSSFTTAVGQITAKRNFWSPQFNVLRYSGEILHSLCDPSVGLLRARSLSPAEREVFREWWDSQWRYLDNAFQQTDPWSHNTETKELKEFCREAMEHAKKLLDQDGLIASALSPVIPSTSMPTNTGDASRQALKDILDHPRRHCMGLCRMLRLKDLYLVEVIVSAMSKLLRRLVEHEMEIPAQPLTYIRDACIRNADGRFNINTNLGDSQRAELVRALGEDGFEDDVQIIKVKKAATAKRQSKLDSWSSSSVAAPSSGLRETSTTKTGRDGIRELMKASSSEKNKSTLELMRARQPTKQMPKPPPISSIPSIREKRAKEAEEKRKRDAEAIARAKALRAPKQTVAGEGSGLQGLSGVRGKTHAPEKSEIMVNSSSEDEDESDDDAEFLAQSAAKPGGTTSKGMKLNPRVPVKKEKIQRSAKDMRARLIPPMDKLHQAILKWDIFHEGNDPPNDHPCTAVSDSYPNHLEYKDTFFPLLINEAWRSFVTAKDEATSKPFGIKVVNRMTVDQFIEVSTAMPIAENKDKFLSEGDIVVFSHAAKPLEAREDLHCLARIWRTQFKNGSLEIQYRLSSRAGPILSSMMPGAELYAVKITNMITIEREYASLESLQYYDLMYEILEAKPSPMLSFSPEKVEETMKNYMLNPGQAKAILNAKENDAFTLVQGPPGTGKTKTIVAMVGALLTGTLSANGATAIKRPNGMGSANNKGTNKKLLVCAPSNAAVDELVLRLKAGVKSTNGTYHKINVVRLGRTDAINAAVKDVTLDELVKARVEGTANQNNGPSSREMMHQEAGKIKLDVAELRPQLEAARAAGDRGHTNQLQRKFDELKRRQAQIGAKIDADKDSGNTAARENEIRRRQVQQEILDSAQVLCATLSGSGHEMFKNLAVEFETVIIDEAAQCVELSALIPLKYGCSKCILVGDPKQLPPTVLSKSAAQYGYDQSLFVRMQRNAPDEIHLLDTQYRMHPEISQFPSQEFYERRLVDGDDMGKLRHQPWHQNGLLGPYRFFDVKGIQAKGRKGQSLVNLEELKVAMQLYERFKTDHPETELKGKVGIITPYKAQLFELRDSFSRRYGERITEDIEFNTTDAFQGRECEIIIFSCVRASPTGGIGFMTDIRRMNVGLTRAKSSLWILGDSRALVQGEFWNKLIENARARDLYTAGDVLALLQRPGSRLPPPKATPLPAPPSIPAPVDHSSRQSDPVTTQTQPVRNSASKDVVMQDAPPANQPVNLPHRPFSWQETYPAQVRYDTGFRPDGRNGTSFGGLNERGEAVATTRTISARPVIHSSGQKRPRESSGEGNTPKKHASGLVKAPPSAPRAMPKAQDPSAMRVLGLTGNQPSSTVNERPPPGPSNRGPPNAPRGPSNPQAPRPPGPPRRRLGGSSNPFIQKKPNRPQ